MNEYGSFVGCRVKILKESCDGYYEDLVNDGKAYTIVDEDLTEDENIMNFTIVTDRPTNNPYLEKMDEIVSSLDVELV